jgi:WD40 repeat protein
VKPGNLLVDAAGKVYVSDFGLARFGPDAGLTVSGDLLGTLRYMAPEQALARHGLVDHRADVYALGATLYELLTGRPAVDAEERAEILRQIAFEEPTPPRKLDKAIPAELETIALKCLAKNPIERYATANELADDLTRFHDDQPIRARRAGPVERVVRWGRRHPAMVAVYGLLVLVLTLATSGGAAAWQWRVAVAALQGKQKAQAGEAEAQRQRDEVRDLNDRLQRTLYAAQMNLTQAAWEANNFLRVKELLNQVRPAAGEPDLRGWEWDYWQRRLPPARLAMTLAQPLRVAVAQDGSFVAEATSTQDGTMIKLYDTATGQVRRTIGPVGDTSRLHLALSGDGKRLATAPLVSEAEDTAPTIRVWDTATGRELFTIPLPRWQAVVHSTFSPDGRRLVTEWFESIRSSKTRIWDLEADKELFVLSAEDLKFSRDGARIAGVTAAGDAVKVWTSSVTGGGDAVKVWDATTGRVLLTLDGPIDRVCDLAFSPDDRQVAAATTKINDGRTTGKVIIWDAVTGRRLHTLPIPAKLSRLEYTPDSRRLVAAAWVGPDPVTVAVWDAASGEAVYTLTPGPGEGTRFSGADVRPLALSPVGSRLACADATGAVTVWDLATGRRRRTLAGHAGRVVRLRFTPDGSRLVTVGQDSQLRVWDATGDDDELITLPMTLPLPQLLNFRSRLALAPNGDRVAGQRPLADGAYELKVWNVADGREVFTASVPASGPGQYVGMMAFSPDGRRLATTAGPESVAGGLPSEVKVWDLTAGRELSTIQRLAANGGRPMTFSPDGVYLALATGPVQNKAGVRVVEAATGRQVWDVDGLNAVTAPLTYSPDGRRLVVCTLDREVELKDILPRRPTPRFSGIVKVLDAATGRELLTISKVESTGISNSVVAFSPSVVAFSPDGRRLATATPDVRRIDVWDADTGQRLLTLDGIDFVADIAYSPDGRRLAVVGREESGPPPPPGARIDRSQIKMWDAEAGRELLTVSTRLSGPMNSPRLTFRPDGHKLIVVGTHSGSRAAVEVFDATPLPPRQVPGPAPLP